MPLTDLSRVTSSLITLLAENIRQNLEPTIAPDITVTPVPPDRVGNVPNTLSLYMYHITEDPYYRNTPGPGNDVPNIATAPMGIKLYYILTAHHDVDTDFDPLIQQKLMGYALKTLHDFPVITDSTEIGGTQILDPLLRGQDNNLQIILRPVAPDEALAYWSAEEQLGARLSAYHEVSIVLLEPEPPRTMPGTVLSVGNFVFQLGSPHLESSRSIVRFTLPQVNGGFDREIQSEPARVALDNTPATTNNRFHLLGLNLAAGRSRQLSLRTARWIRLDPSVPRALIDPDLNLANGWTLSFRSERITVDIGSTLDSVDEQGNPVTLDVLPGIYSAQLSVVIDERLIAGERRALRTSSNEIGFVITPRISGHAPPDVPNNRITINLVPAFDLSHGAPDPVEQLDIQIVVAGQTYLRIPDFAAVPPDAPVDKDGTFVVGPSSITFQALFDVSVAGTHPFGLIVEGADAQPFWIEIP